MQKQKCTAIVLAAGQGKRMGTKVQKQYLEISGKPVLFYSLDVFQKSDLIDEIILVVGKDQGEYCQKEIVEKYNITKVNKIVEGGAERYNSVWNGLQEVEDGFVFIHDGARPFVNEEILLRAYDAVQNEKACVVGMPVKDTIKIADANTFAKETNVDVDNRLICYDILDLGKQLLPIGMLVVLDNILNRITANRAKGKHTFIFIDEIYLLFQHEYSANFLFTLWKRVRKYGAYCTGITQNVDDLLQSHTARTMLANSEFLIMLNQASTDRLRLAELVNISDMQMSYITNVEAGRGLMKVGSALVPFFNKFPKHTKLYKLMTTKPGEV